jgi:hypothetical protein
MTVLIVLFGSWLALRAVGALGVSYLAAWSTSGRYALAAMFVFTSIAHFAKQGRHLQNSGSLRYLQNSGGQPKYSMARAL